MAKNDTLKILLAVLLFVSLIVVGYLLLREKDDDSEDDDKEPRTVIVQMPAQQPVRERVMYMPAPSRHYYHYDRPRSYRRSYPKKQPQLQQAQKQILSQAKQQPQQQVLKLLNSSGEEEDCDKTMLYVIIGILAVLLLALGAYCAYRK